MTERTRRGFFNAEFFVPLKPESAWPKGGSKEALAADMSHALESKYPGVSFNFSQYIEDNVEEAASGVKGENSVKIFGLDLQTLESTANQIAAVLKTVPGITDLAALRSLGQPTLQIVVDRERAARFGLTPGDVNATVQVAIGGQAAGDLYEPGSDRPFSSRRSARQGISWRRGGDPKDSDRSAGPLRKRNRAGGAG